MDLLELNRCDAARRRREQATDNPDKSGRKYRVFRSAARRRCCCRSEGCRASEPVGTDRARFGEAKISALVGDAAIIRHRGKIEATINNAGRCLELQEQHGSLARYVWGFEPPASERPAAVTHAALMELTQTYASRSLSRDLKQRGWRFVGPTTAYAAMQAMGIVDDHLAGCWCREVDADPK